MKILIPAIVVFLLFGYMSYRNQTWHKDFVTQGEEKEYVIVTDDHCADMIDPYSWIKAYSCQSFALSPKETKQVDNLQVAIPMKSVKKGSDAIYNVFIIFNKIFVEYKLLYQDENGKYTKILSSEEFEKNMSEDTKDKLINAMMECSIWGNENIG